MNEHVINYHNELYKISCTKANEAFSLIKVYKFKQSKWQLRYLFAAMKKGIVIITNITSDNNKCIKYFHKQILKYYRSIQLGTLINPCLCN